MGLLEAYKTPCVLLENRNTPDGEGGYKSAWTAGKSFRAAIVFLSTLEARKAEREGVTSLYNITVDKDIFLQYHDVFRRLSDGKIFRVTSDGDDVRSPAMASFRFAQVTAEEWNLTT